LNRLPNSRPQTQAISRAPRAPANPATPTPQPASPVLPKHRNRRILYGSAGLTPFVCNKPALQNRTACPAFAAPLTARSDIHRPRQSPKPAFPPFAGLLTMCPRQAASVCRMIQPRRVVPVPLGAFPALTGTPAQLAGPLPHTPAEVRTAL